MIDHYYIFSRRRYGDVYERTVPNERIAMDRIVELKQRGVGAYFTRNALPARWFY